MSQEEHTKHQERTIEFQEREIHGMDIAMLCSPIQTQNLFIYEGQIVCRDSM